ncbi:transmembrane amino acid transporter protein-domain-containing protein [Entophlyctis helioformis]|nr:transmembrane amino acid transporter protein-domain-containing protein [Entophlyctis helioformis]
MSVPHASLHPNPQSASSASPDPHDLYDPYVPSDPPHPDALAHHQHHQHHHDYDHSDSSSAAAPIGPYGSQTTMAASLPSHTGPYTHSRSHSRSYSIDRTLQSAGSLIFKSNTALDTLATLATYTDDQQPAAHERRASVCNSLHDASLYCASAAGGSVVEDHDDLLTKPPRYPPPVPPEMLGIPISSRPTLLYPQTREPPPPRLNMHGRPYPSVTASVIDLCNTIMGTGLMSIPYAFATVGLGYGIFLVFASAAATWFSLRLLVSSAQLAYGSASGGRIPSHTSLFIAQGEPSYGALAKTAMGRRGAVWADIAMAVSCFGFAVSYLVAIADSMPAAAAYLFPADLVGSWLAGVLQNPQFWIFAFIVVIGPLCYARSVDDFWWFSSTALGAALYLAFVVIGLSFIVPHPHHGRLVDHPSVPWFSLKLEAFESITIYIFAFTCHQNIFTIYNEIDATYHGSGLAPETVMRIRRVIDMSVMSVAGLYLAVGIVGYLAFGDSTNVVLFDNLPDTFLVVVGRLMYALLAALSVPIQVHPCRASLDSILNTLGYRWRVAHAYGYQPLGESTASLLSSSSSSAPTSRRPSMLFSTPSSQLPALSASWRKTWSHVVHLLQESMQEEGGRRLVLTSFALLLVYFTALWFSEVEVIMSFVGGTSGVVVCFVLPALFYWRLTTEETGGWRRPLSAGLAVGGCLCGILNIGWILAKLFDNTGGGNSGNSRVSAS